MEPNNAYITLSQFQRRVTNTIRMNPDLQSAWVLAELSDVRPNGGHCYMELVEKDDNGGIRAKIRAMIWRGTYEPLRRKFMDATGGDLRSGIKLLVRGSATHHEVYGLSFVISDIDPSYTLGETERIRREILARLTREGVIDRNRSLPVPLLPQRVAVISAAGAAGYGDFTNQLASNSYGFIFYPMLFPAVMKGANTAPSVLKMLDWVEHTAFMWDCVIIIRGGGATTDLNSFDNYELAHRVATFPIPVVVGIGHERDRTVLDDIACVRCKTPTAVAAWLVEQLDDAFRQAYDSSVRIGRYVSEAMKGEHMRLAQIEASLPATVVTRTMRERVALQRIASNLSTALGGRTTAADARLQVIAGRVAAAARSSLDNAAARLKRLEDMHRILSPQNTLSRGYSITRVNGHAVTDAADLKPGDTIETTLLNGTVFSEITGTHPAGQEP